MKNKQLSSEKTIQKIQKLRKIFLWAAVWILIVELVFGAILILMGAWETRGASSGADWFLSANKVQGTFLILAAILFVGVNNFVHIEKGSKTVRIFALLGFACNLIWAILAILLVWELIPFYWVETITKTFPHTGHSYSYNTYHTTFWVTTMLVFIYASLGCFCVSNIMSIAETVKLVKPLKITAVVCAIYLWAFETVVVIANLDYSKIGRLVLLSGLAGTALVMTALAANIISKTNQDKAPADPNAVKIYVEYKAGVMKLGSINITQLTARRHCYLTKVLRLVFMSYRVNTWLSRVLFTADRV